MVLDKCLREHFQKMKVMDFPSWILDFVFHFLQKLRMIFGAADDCRLPIWSLTTKKVTEPTTRLCNRAFRIQGNFLPWTHHCSALSHPDTTTFQNYTNNQVIKFYYLIQNNNTSPTLTGLVPRNNTRQEWISRCAYPSAGLRSHIILEQ